MLTPQVIVPTLLVPLIGYRLYRRFRANFGRQPVQQTRMVVLLSPHAPTRPLVLRHDFYPFVFSPAQAEDIRARVARVSA